MTDAVMLPRELFDRIVIALDEAESFMSGFMDDDTQEEPIDGVVEELGEIAAALRAMPAPATPATPRVKMVCRTCKSDDVLRDAWAEWDVDTQEWVLQNVFDHAICGGACDGETKIEEIAI